MPRRRRHDNVRVFTALLFSAAAVSGSTVAGQVTSSTPTLELTRPARPWEFVSAVGTQAGIFGNESGRIEAWVYPLKISRDFHLRFHTEDRILAAETLARTVIVKPESTTIVYTSDTFAVRETFFVPVNEPGAVVSSKWKLNSP